MGDKSLFKFICAGCSFLKQNPYLLLNDVECMGKSAKICVIDCFWSKLQRASDGFEIEFDEKSLADRKKDGKTFYPL